MTRKKKGLNVVSELELLSKARKKGKKKSGAEGGRGNEFVNCSFRDRAANQLGHRASCALLSSWHHDGQTHPDKRTTVNCQVNIHLPPTSTIPAPPLNKTEKRTLDENNAASWRVDTAGKIGSSFSRSTSPPKRLYHGWLTVHYLCWYWSELRWVELPFCSLISPLKYENYLDEALIRFLWMGMTWTRHACMHTEAE